ncbi:MAG: hypothetical protein CSA33_00310 [Desulfobulbus propionicus]|nr:MAG: hypothetical protein CSA33_00310 [Desulfobulbus propionicus]
MTDILKNSSELAAAVALLNDLLLPLPESLQYDVFHNFHLPVQHEVPDAQTQLFNGGQSFAITPLEQSSKPGEVVQEPFTFIEEEDSDKTAFTSDRLENLLESLCRQSGFQSAVVADKKGLPIGGVNTPDSIDVLAAFSAVLGDVLDKVPHFLNQYESGNISLDINYVDKAVVQKIFIDEEHFYLLIICSQDIDERAYIELFNQQITRILKK